MTKRLEASELAMRPVAGGQVPPARVLGRERLIKKLWRRLEHQGVLLLAERRIGKTSVLKKMAAEPADGWVAKYVVVESVRNPATFVERVLDACSDLLPKAATWRQRVAGVFDRLGGTKVGDWEMPEIQALWRSLLLDLLDSLSRHDKRVAILIDEFPSAVGNIRQDAGSETAMELLDTLRTWQLAERSDRVRLLYTGSIGLHVVLSELADAGYRGAPTNMMAKQSLGPLEGDAAQTLAHRGLLALEQDGDIEFQEGELDAAAVSIASLTDALPFYVDQLIEQLSERSEAGELPDVEQTLVHLLDHPDDPAFFRHYADRIDNYYKGHRGPLAHALLGILSADAEGRLEVDLAAEVVAGELGRDLPQVQEVLGLLQEDHYIVRRPGEERGFRFKYGIIRNWWRRNRA